MNIRFHIGIALATAILAAPPAAGRQETRAAKVSLAGLDLTSAADRDRVHAQVNNMAKAVCTYEADDRPGEMARDQRSCIKKALQDARRQVALATSRAFAMSEPARLVAER